MDAPRRSHATETADVPPFDRRRTTMSNGGWGMLLFICTEGALFGSLIASYFYLQFTSSAWPPRGVEAPSVALPLVLTGALVLTAAPMLAASRAAGRGRVRLTQGLIAVATLFQGGYLAVQIVSYLSDLDKFSISGSVYGSIYFTLLGAHHAHVAVGLLLNLWLLARLTAGLTAYRLIAVRVITWYWVFVVVLAVFVVATQVSPS